ncbi:MAG: sugar phosphate isomerase/epimerase [Chloroflexi bacterium]|nr:sugar phosphate isomerase/epimerase [Chloroflexota bacterium]
MRLGVVGMMPPDFRAINSEHLAGVRALGLSGVGFHAPGRKLFDVTSQECRQVRGVFASAGMELVQFGIGYGECLFAPDPAARAEIVGVIGRGIEVAAELGAQVCLIRTGSLNLKGSYAPVAENHTRQSWQRLIETLRRIADKAEQVGQTVVIETHLLTILDSPEANRDAIAEVGSARLRVVMDYVNHFPSVQHVFHSTDRLNHIFDLMGPIAGVGHCKDIRFGDGLVLHIDEAIPGEGLLDLPTALRRWQALYPNGYMLLEHLPNEQYPQAAANTLRIAAEAGVEVH